jgi:hypothetical protein
LNFPTLPPSVFLFSLESHRQEDWLRETVPVILRCLCDPAATWFAQMSRCFISTIVSVTSTSSSTKKQTALPLSGRLFTVVQSPRLWGSQNPNTSTDENWNKATLAGVYRDPFGTSKEHSIFVRITRWKDFGVPKMTINLTHCPFETFYPCHKQSQADTFRLVQLPGQDPNGNNHPEWPSRKEGRLLPWETPVQLSSHLRHAQDS